MPDFQDNRLQNHQLERLYPNAHGYPTTPESVHLNRVWPPVDQSVDRETLGYHKLPEPHGRPFCERKRPGWGPPSVTQPEQAPCMLRESGRGLCQTIQRVQLHSACHHLEVCLEEPGLQFCFGRLSRALSLANQTCLTDSLSSSIHQLLTIYHKEQKPLLCRSNGLKKSVCASQMPVRKIFFRTYCFSKKKIENARTLNKTTWKYLFVCDPASEFV